MTILAAVGEKERATPVVEVGYDLAQAYDDDLIVLHVIPEDDARSHVNELRKIAEFSDMSYDVEEERAEEFAALVIENSLGEHQTDRVTARGRIGPPVEVILSEAAQTDARYLVMGPKKRTPTGKAIFGSVTQSVLLNSERPVVTVTRDSE